MRPAWTVFSNGLPSEIVYLGLCVDAETREEVAVVIRPESRGGVVSPTPGFVNDLFARVGVLPAGAVSFVTVRPIPSCEVVELYVRQQVFPTDALGSWKPASPASDRARDAILSALGIAPARVARQLWNGEGGVRLEVRP